MRTTDKIIADVRSLAKQDGADLDTPGYQDSFLLTILDRGNKSWATAMRGFASISPFTQKILVYEQSATETIVDSVANTIELTSTSGMETTGSILVPNNNEPYVVSYTGINNQLLTGTSETLAADTTIQKLQKLPSDYDSLRETKQSEYGVTLDGTPLTFTEDNPSTNEFSIIDNHLWIGSTGTVRVTYYSLIDTLTTGSEVSVPEKNDFYLVHYVLHYLYTVIGMNVDKVINQENKAKNILKAAKKDAGISHGVKVNKIQNQRFGHTNVTTLPKA